MLAIAMFLVTSPIVINVPSRSLLAVETMHAIVQQRCDGKEGIMCFTEVLGAKYIEW